MLKKLFLVISIFLITISVINFSKANYTFKSIPYEEALSELMNQSKIFIDSQNNQILEVIDSGYNYPNLSSSIKPRNLDGTTYKYYGFFKKASEYEIVSYDNSGNKNIYKLIDNISSINPKSIITKSQYDKILFAISKVNGQLSIPYVGNGLSSITTNFVSGNAPFVINFKGDTILTGLGYSYEWDFGDGATGFGKNVNYIYVLPGNYKVKLSVIDNSGNIGTSSKDISVLGNNSCTNDSDGDSLDDCIDACPLVFGEKINTGCPIFTTQINDNQDLGNECLYYDKQSIIYGNYICNTCPCNFFADFYADVRKCDFIFPALISSDGKDVYSKGKYFQVSE